MNRISRIDRRSFLRNGTLVLSTAALAPTALAFDKNVQTLGIVTDMHYADKPAAGSRFYRETPEKLAAAAMEFSKHDIDFVVELGDFIDAADDVATELGFLKRINKDFSALSDNRHYVLGNHCVHTLTKREFLDGVEKPRSYYSFDSGNYHFVVLDSCFRSDGEPYGRKNFQWTDPNIPQKELEWLKEDLRESAKPTIVFAHQRLDVSNHYGVKNCEAVRAVLESSGNVRAVFQGHSHKNDHNDIGGIHYCTLVAMVEGSGTDNNGYSVVRLAKEAIEISGFCKQSDYSWKSGG